MRIQNLILAGSMILILGCQSFDESASEAHHTQTSSISTGTIKTSTVQTIIPPKDIVKAKINVAEVTDVWQRIRLNLSFDVPEQKLIKQYRDWYIKHPQHLEKVSERAAPYLYLIVEEVEKRDLPIELALLPIIESAFDPTAYSNSAASGFWQFTSPMAKYFGLQINDWYDGRRDVPAATTAALDMLEYLYKKTGGNWLYAIAAYNTGEGRVINAVKNNKRKGKPTDFWSLTLPTETQRYVPQLLALADVIKHADKYGIKLHPINNKPQIQVIDVGEQFDLSLAAGFAGMTTSELRKINPGYDHWLTPPNGPHTLVLPVDRVPTFNLALANIHADDKLNKERYQIRSGDSLGLIAQKYHTTPSALRAANALKGNTIITGRYLVIPVPVRNQDKDALSLKQRLKSKQNKSPDSEKIDYIVKSGDSLWKLAKSHKVTIAQLAKWNHMSVKDSLKIGQKLTIWTANTHVSDVTRKLNYTVRSGDSLGHIAAKFNVSVKDLIRWNTLGKHKYIQPGQKLKLYLDMKKIKA
ncbi:lytic transglycosylase [Shewanella violacea]|uniref:Transglycosylase, Slt family n=1 Tax=Shewanella violacea (strain JCM 10179 / CIP 106290 / LMG 19151 / DSS12) TaxID=637905 RepID=D4ZL11_SHEVD|nr:LysM peptidoglycan-binding domain-containing protein [Shewanella violacea]BAJ02360.1 transglycosylase, Slt family [Shewanella violacea DSS12]